MLFLKQKLSIFPVIYGRRHLRASSNSIEKRKLWVPENASTRQSNRVIKSNSISESTKSAQFPNK